MTEIAVVEAPETAGEAGTRATRKRRMEMRKVGLGGGVVRRKVELEVERREDGKGFGLTSVCGRRSYMEDAVAVEMGFSDKKHFFGVFDGHGCSHVAMSCKDRMHELVADEIESVKIGSTKLDWLDVMKKSFAQMDAEVAQLRPATTTEKKANCRCVLPTSKCDHVGSTAVVAVVSADQIVVANCGDSRAVLSRGGIAIPLSSDHKPDRPDELKRIQDAGGRVIYWDIARVECILAMSRAIGDNLLKPFVIPEPEVTITDRTDDDEFLILASDGLWDVVSNKMACEVVRMCLKGGTTDTSDGHNACFDATFLLTKLALARNSSDNVSIVVVDLRKTRTSTSVL